MWSEAAKQQPSPLPRRPCDAPSKSPGRPRTESQPPDAEMKIREAALDLFAAKNFSSVTIKDIAAATGLNAALIYYYFGSKEELFRLAVALAVERAFHRFKAGRLNQTCPREIIGRWLDTHVRECETITKLVRIAIDYAGTAKRKRAVDSAIRRFYEEERHVLREALQDGITAGQFRAVDVEKTATFISTYLDGVIVRAVILRDFDARAAIEEFRVLLASLLDKQERT